jgi:hypothetical protein
MRIKTNAAGEPVALQDNEIIRFNKETGHPTEITVFPSRESAKTEFNRITSSYRGCGKNIWRPRACATAYYSQLIITL